jgi:hypothetical protein
VYLYFVTLSLFGKDLLWLELPVAAAAAKLLPLCARAARLFWDFAFAAAPRLVPALTWGEIGFKPGGVYPGVV